MLRLQTCAERLSADYHRLSRVLVMYNAPWTFADDRTELMRWACGEDGCDRYQGFPSVTENEHVCDVRIELGGETLDAQLFRLGSLGYSPVDPNEEVDPEFGPFDARAFIVDVRDEQGEEALGTPTRE